VGQLVRTGFGSEKEFEVEAQKIIDKRFSERKGELARRKRLLSEIPFDAILTTNYDPALDGASPSSDSYRRILRRPQSWWERSQWSEPEPAKPRNVIKLHGDANGDPKRNPIVIGRNDYRRLVHGNPFYAPFLRAIFATRTVLFLGVSFTDAYLNELRSEVLGMLSPNEEKGSSREPLAYAVLPNRDGAWKRYFLEHEGIQLLPYSASGTDHSGFDRWLEAIHEATAPVKRLSHLLNGKTIVWIDRSRGNNKHGLEMLEKAGAILRPLASLEQLTDKDLEADLLLTNFGYRKASSAVAFDVLERLRRSPQRPPVIVFAGGDHAAENRKEVLRRGAFEYASGWSELFGLIERLFGREVGY
jgi:hypothetical protein